MAGGLGGARMTLVIEKHGNAVWLCLRESPDAAHSILLAKFVHAEAAELYKNAHDRAMCFAREVGRASLA